MEISWPNFHTKALTLNTLSQCTLILKFSTFEGSLVFTKNERIFDPQWQKIGLIKYIKYILNFE
jgi:hypothetical protein